MKPCFKIYWRKSESSPLFLRMLACCLRLSCHALFSLKTQHPPLITDLLFSQSVCVEGGLRLLQANNSHSLPAKEEEGNPITNALRSERPRERERETENGRWSPSDDDAIWPLIEPLLLAVPSVHQLPNSAYLQTMMGGHDHINF